jgi:hypothetical protein
MTILVQFLLRLTFGLAAGMIIASPRQVTSGYFRNNLYVALGLTTLAALVSYAAAPEEFWYAVGAAVASYVGSVCWLYEKRFVGAAALAIVAIASLIGTAELLGAIDELKEQSVAWDNYFPARGPNIMSAEVEEDIERARRMGYWNGALLVISNISSGLLMGMTVAAMLLGHWYLNSPTMELAPLRRLLLAVGAAVVLQAAVSAVGLACELNYAAELSTQTLLFILLRWSFGLFGVAVLVWMAWQSLKIPNTQSATGILYVAVVGAIVGELTGMLLSAESAFPL